MDLKFSNFQHHDVFKDSDLGKIIYKRLIKIIHLLYTPFNGQNFKT